MQMLSEKQTTLLTLISGRIEIGSRKRETSATNKTGKAKKKRSKNLGKKAFYLLIWLTLESISSEVWIDFELIS